MNTHTQHKRIISRRECETAATDTDSTTNGAAGVGSVFSRPDHLVVQQNRQNSRPDEKVILFTLVHVAMVMS